MRKSFSVAVLLAALVSSPSLIKANSVNTPTDTAEMRMHALFEWSMQNKRGISIHMQGDVIHGVVKELLGDAVVLGNEDRATIIVRRDRISAVAGQ